jgi:outer membrane protein assembly factor BamA
VLNSDFEYRRTRGVIGADIGLGSWAALLPQFVYGRLTGTPIPQAAFFLGGSRSLRGVHSASRGGTGYAFGRLELIGTTDVLKAARIPHPSAFPIQLATFVGAGAVWGQDPLGGPTRPGVNWPNLEEWSSEVGLAALYQPGFPDRTGLVRFNYTWPLGPSIESPRLTIAYSRAMDLLRPFAR